MKVEVPGSEHLLHIIVKYYGFCIILREREVGGREGGRGRGAVLNAKYFSLFIPRLFRRAIDNNGKVQHGLRCS